MRIILSVLVLLILVAFTYNKSNTDLLADTIVYNVQIEDEDGKYEKFYNKIDTAARRKLINAVLQMALEGKVQAHNYFNSYSPEGNYSLPIMTPGQIYSSLNWVDTQLTQNINTGLWDTVLVKRSLKHKNFDCLSFVEAWTFDKQKLHLEKTVKGFAINYDKINRATGEFMGYNPLFYFNCNTNTTKAKKDSIVIKDIIYDVEIRKRGNCLYDLGEEVEWWLHLEQSKRNILLLTLEDTVASNKLKLYFPQYPFNNVMKKEMYGHLIDRIDTMINVNLGNIDTVFVPVRLDWTTQIRIIRFYEEWVFYPNEFIFKKKVKGIALLKDEYNRQTGDELPRKPLFYIPFN